MTAIDFTNRCLIPAWPVAYGRPGGAALPHGGFPVISLFHGVDQPAPAAAIAVPTGRQRAVMIAQSTLPSSGPWPTARPSIL